MRYAVNIVEHKSDLVFIQADSREEAEAIAKANLDNGMIQLSDHVELEITASPAAVQEVSPYDQDYTLLDDDTYWDQDNINDSLSDLR